MDVPAAVIMGVAVMIVTMVIVMLMPIVILRMVIVTMVGSVVAVVHVSRFLDPQVSVSRSPQVTSGRVAGKRGLSNGSRGKNKHSIAGKPCICPASNHVRR